MSRRVLVTGCSTGIGRALATELSRRGLEVIATARQLQALADVPAAQRLALDVTDESSIGRALEAAGPIDVLVNNAGIGAWGAVEPATTAEIQALFDTNVFGPLRLIRAVLPQMRERGRGALYQVSSAAAHRSNALLGHYAATKAALEAYSEALRVELAQFGISVTIVVLGAVETAFAANRRYMSAPAYEDLIRRVKARIESNRREPATAEAVASSIADSIVDDRAPLRLNATADAVELVAQRRRLTDEEWERVTLEGLFPPGG
jgi:short-subunit dehydrogenase